MKKRESSPSGRNHRPCLSYLQFPLEFRAVLALGAFASDRWCYEVCQMRQAASIVRVTQSCCAGNRPRAACVGPKPITVAVSCGSRRYMCAPQSPRSGGCASGSAGPTSLRVGHWARCLAGGIGAFFRFDPFPFGFLVRQTRKVNLDKPGSVALSRCTPGFFTVRISGVAKAGESPGGCPAAQFGPRAPLR